jgi:Ca2+-binding EF-hand superfamily protein
MGPSCHQAKKSPLKAAPVSESKTDGSIGGGEKEGREESKSEDGVDEDDSFDHKELHLVKGLIDKMKDPIVKKQALADEAIVKRVCGRMKNVSENQSLNFIFRSFDDKKTGFCTAVDVGVILEQLGVKIVETEAQALFSTFYKPGQGIDYPRLIEMVHPQPKKEMTVVDIENMDAEVSGILAKMRESFESKTSLQRIFQGWDENKDGVVDKREMTLILKASNFEISAEGIDKLMDAFDKSGAGKISYPAFIDSVYNEALKDTAYQNNLQFKGKVVQKQTASHAKRLRDNVGKSHNRAEELRTQLSSFFEINSHKFSVVFRKMDDDKDGCITPGELARAVKGMRLGDFSEDDCAALISSMDDNDDGMLQLHEFADYFRLEIMGKSFLDAKRDKDLDLKDTIATAQQKKRDMEARSFISVESRSQIESTPDKFRLASFAVFSPEMRNKGMTVAKASTLPMVSLRGK